MNANCKPLAAKYGRLTVLKRVSGTRAICACDCGSPAKTFHVGSLRTGNTKSCGCLARERQADVGRASGTHRLSGTSVYRTWQQLRSRCLDATDKSFSNYGGRGIKVCDRWKDSFENFLSDMGTRPTRSHSIDRRDNDGDYCPDNCRWATKTEQTRNRRNAINVCMNGETKPLKIWCDELGVNYYSAHRRLRRDGMTPEQALKLAPTEKKVTL